MLLTSLDKPTLGRLSQNTLGLRVYCFLSSHTVFVRRSHSMFPARFSLVLPGGAIPPAEPFCTRISARLKRVHDRSSPPRGCPLGYRRNLLRTDVCTHAPQARVKEARIKRHSVRTARPPQQLSLSLPPGRVSSAHNDTTWYRMTPPAKILGIETLN